MRMKKLLVMPLIALILAGCATAMDIESTADTSYTKVVHILFIIGELPHETKGELLFMPGESTLVSRTDPKRKQALYKLFATTIVEEADKLGLKATCEMPTGLELGVNSVGDKVEAYSPDAVLVFDCTTINLLNGHLTSSVYDVSLYDYPTNKRHWRAKMTVSNSMTTVYANGLAKELFAAFVNQLKTDNMNILGTIEPVAGK